MHWGGEPSTKVLIRVVKDLEARGWAPIVVFDANVGYKLSGRYMRGTDLAALMDLPAAHVFVVQKGVVADEVLLDLARTHRLKVVSDDRFRDWRAQFPGIATKGALVQGQWKDGSVVWRDARLLRAPEAVGA